VENIRVIWNRRTNIKKKDLKGEGKTERGDRGGLENDSTCSRERMRWKRVVSRNLTITVLQGGRKRGTLYMRKARAKIGKKTQAGLRQKLRTIIQRRRLCICTGERRPRSGKKAQTSQKMNEKPKARIRTPHRGTGGGKWHMVHADTDGTELVSGKTKQYIKWGKGQETLLVVRPA